MRSLRPRWQESLARMALEVPRRANRKAVWGKRVEAHPVGPALILEICADDEVIVDNEIDPASFGEDGSSIVGLARCWCSHTHAAKTRQEFPVWLDHAEMAPFINEPPLTSDLA